MRRRVYVAGPLSDPDPAIRRQNVERAQRATAALIRAGYAPLCPHLSHWMDPNDELGYENWLAVDFAWVAVADAVFRLAGPSPGTEREVALAAELGIPVVSTIAELEEVLCLFPPATHPDSASAAAPSPSAPKGRPPATTRRRRTRSAGPGTSAPGSAGARRR